MTGELREDDGVRVLAIVHEAWAGPGVFGDVFDERGDSLDEWMLPERAEPPADPLGYDAVFVLGGAMNIDEEGEHGWLGAERGLIGRLLEREVPLMGLCLGGQMVAAAAGAVPRRAPRPEIGWHGVELTPAGLEDPVLGPLGPRLRVLPVAQLRVPAAAGRGRARPHGGLPAGLPDRRGRLGAPVPPRGDPHGRPALDRRLGVRPRRRRDRPRPDRARPRDRGEDRRFQRTWA